VSRFISTIGYTVLFPLIHTGK